MPPNLLPFLYQTRTLQQAFRAPVSSVFLRLAHYDHGAPGRRRPAKRDVSIPFEMGSGNNEDIIQQDSTITPNEAEIFKGIFDEIAQGRMPAARKRPLETAGTPTSPTQMQSEDTVARSIVEQARVTEFRDKFLRRYPTSLRIAAQKALGLFELDVEEPGSQSMMELDESSNKLWEERLKYDRARNEEKERVDALMQECKTDHELWQFLEAEVFSLPRRLGIAEPEAAKKKGRKKAAIPELVPESDKRIMDVHGPLYSHFLNRAVALFDTGFAVPSDYVFAVLPRIKQLGLPSYVLGASTPFYTRLAQIHWERYGDATSALDMLQEMNETGLYPDADVAALLLKMRNHLHGCTWGAQGPFVMTMMEAPPYDGALVARLDEMDEHVRTSLGG